MRKLHPDLWVGPSPNGIGQQKPDHYGEMTRAVWANRRHPKYAWDVLSKGVCDGCALGVAGFHDWTIDGVHLCTTRLRLLEFNTMDALDHERLADVADLEGLSTGELRELGRLAYPMRRRGGDRGFRRIEWDEALDVLSNRLSDTDPDRVAMYLTSRGLTNETYYTAGKAARAMGIANIDSAARVCHAPSTLGLKSTVGVTATTCSLQDVMESDLIVIWGANPANNQPVFMKYLYLARIQGTRVVVVNPYLEPGLERYWVPSNAESALFGTQMCDLHVPVRPGGDAALADALLKVLIDRDAVDREWIAAHAYGWDELLSTLEKKSLDDLLQTAGIDRETLDAFADEYAAADSAILLWSMGVTQHRDSVDTVRGIVNVALARGNVGRDGAGLMPLRGHSGVQGGAEMGAYATSFPGGAEPSPESAAALADLWGFDVPDHVGLTAPEVLELAEAGDLDVLWSSGGNFLDVLPDPAFVRRALRRPGLRVHQDVVLTPQMLVEGDDVILLPVTTRYEQEGGGTETTTERRIVYSPEIPRQVGQARSEWRLFADVASRVRPDLRHLFSWPDNAALRSEIAEVVPFYAGIETLSETGDQVQYGGRHLCADGNFPTPSGRARFSVLDHRRSNLGEGEFSLATRRGKQFNSIVWEEIDPLTGATRDAVYIDRADADALGFDEGDRVVLRNEVGEMAGRVHLARLPHRTIQVHWPEGNVLIAHGARHREPESQVPDYNARVTIHALGREGSPPIH